MAKDEVIRLRISAEDKATIQAAGAISLLGASAFMLNAALVAARKTIENAKAKRTVATSPSKRQSPVATVPMKGNKPFVCRLKKK